MTVNPYKAPASRQQVKGQPRHDFVLLLSTAIFAGLWCKFLAFVLMAYCIVSGVIPDGDGAEYWQPVQWVGFVVGVGAGLLRAQMNPRRPFVYSFLCLLIPVPVAAIVLEISWPVVGVQIGWKIAFFISWLGPFFLLALLRAEQGLDR